MELQVKKNLSIDEYKAELGKILKTKHNWSIDEYKTYFNVNENEVYNIMLDYLKTELSNLDFEENTNKYMCLYKIFNYFDNLENKEIQNLFVELLKKAKQEIEEKISNAKKNINTKVNSNSVVLMNDIIDVFLLKFSFMKGNENNNQERVNFNFEFFKKLIYNIKKYDYVCEIFKRTPKFLYTNVNCNQIILEELVEHYINLVKLGDNHYDIIYFEKIIKLFSTSKKFKLEKNYLNRLVDKFNLSLENLKREKLKKTEIDRIKFFIEGLIKELKKSHDFYSQEYLNNLDYKYGINPNFSSLVLQDARFSKRIDKKPIMNLKNKFTITIDRPGTKMIEDACSFEILKDGRYLLNIYVSDVDSYLYRNFSLDISAYERAKSIYFPHHQIDMFPREFSSKLSLNKNEGRFVIAYSFLFDKDMNILNLDVNRALIKVDYNLNYNDIDNILTKSYDLELYKFLKTMIISSDILREKQSKLNSNIKKNNDHDFLSTFIILMNNCIAEIFNDNKHIPFPYCVNLSQYDDYIIRQLKEKIENKPDYSSIITAHNEIRTPSFYTTENLGHNELNLRSYCNVSTPLRSYISLITERLVKHHIIDNNENPIFNFEEMNKLCEYFNNRKQLNDEYVEEYMKTYQLQKSKKIDKNKKGGKINT